MSAPTVVYELMYTDSTVIDSTRTTHAGSPTNYWFSRNLPGSGKAMLDSTIDGHNCEVSQFQFSGHGQGNYVTNFKFYVANRNAVATDMTFLYKATSTFADPSGYTDADIYNYTADFSDCPVSVPGTPNINTRTGWNAYDDPTFTEFIFFGVAIEAQKTTGTGTWNTKLLYQYT